MNKLLTGIAIMAASSMPAFAAEQPNYYYEVTGDEVFKDHSLNQFDDIEHPPQAFRLTIPSGYRLEYSATPDDGGGQKCEIKTETKRTLLIDASNLEVDEGGCYAFLIFRNHMTGDQRTVAYYIYQMGT